MRSDRVSVKQLVFKLDLDHPQLQASLKRFQIAAETL